MIANILALAFMLIFALAVLVFTLVPLGTLIEGLREIDPANIFIGFFGVLLVPLAAVLMAILGFTATGIGPEWLQGQSPTRDVSIQINQETP